MISETVLNTPAPRGCGIVYGYYYNGVLVYVGSTRTTIGKRAKENGRGYVYSKCACKFGNFILLHGWENLDVKDLATPLLSELTKVEDELIDANDLINNGCNIYHACVDDDDTNEYTETINGYKANVYHYDYLRGDVRVGLIHDQMLKLNFVDKDIFKGYYVAQQHGNKLEGNSLGFFDETGSLRGVSVVLREKWFGDFAKVYNISQGKLAEDIYDYRREVLWANPCGRAYKKRPLTDVLKDLELGINPFPSKRKKAGAQ